MKADQLNSQKLKFKAVCYAEVACLQTQIRILT